MGKTFAMSGIMDWLKAASIGKISAKVIGKDTKESIQNKIKALRKASIDRQKGSEE